MQTKKRSCKFSSVKLCPDGHLIYGAGIAKQPTLECYLEPGEYLVQEICNLVMGAEPEQLLPDTVVVAILTSWQAVFDNIGRSPMRMGM